MATKHDTMTMLQYEYAYLAKGIKNICGVDEVGRGPLAGPVVVCALIMPLADEDIIQGVNDSKKLSQKKRELLYDLIMDKAICVNLQYADEKVIDEINILNATKKCMTDAINSLEVVPQIALIDAVNIPVICPVEPIIKGDSISYSIACASIVAKVVRDRLMAEYHEQYPHYGFASNKGYGSAQHIQAIREKGACPIHRKSFIKNFV